ALPRWASDQSFVTELQQQFSRIARGRSAAFGACRQQASPRFAVAQVVRPEADVGGTQELERGGARGPLMWRDECGRRRGDAEQRRSWHVVRANRASLDTLVLQVVAMQTDLAHASEMRQVEEFGDGRAHEPLSAVLGAVTREDQIEAD